MGIYKFPELIGGRPAWYSRGVDGGMRRLEIVPVGVSDAETVDDLIVDLYGTRRPSLLRLVVEQASTDAASRVQRPWPPFLTASIARARLSRSPVPPAGR